MTPVHHFLLHMHTANAACDWANGVLYFLQLRHPNILQFKETAEVEERGETVIYLVTEACMPLADHLQRLDIQVRMWTHVRWHAHRTVIAVNTERV